MQRLAEEGVLEEMRERLEEWMRETDDPLLGAGVPLPPEEFRG